MSVTALHTAWSALQAGVQVSEPRSDLVQLKSGCTRALQALHEAASAVTRLLLQSFDVDETSLSVFLTYPLNFVVVCAL